MTYLLKYYVCFGLFIPGLRLTQLTLPGRHSVTDAGLTFLSRLSLLSELDLTDYTYVTDQGVTQLATMTRSALSHNYYPLLVSIYTLVMIDWHSVVTNLCLVELHSDFNSPFRLTCCVRGELEQKSAHYCSHGLELVVTALVDSPASSSVDIAVNEEMLGRIH